MKGLIAIAAVISCLWVIASAQSCEDQAKQLASCISQLAVAAISGNTASFCNNCGNPLYVYFRNCVDGGDVTPVTRGKFI